ncbi:MAG: DUF2500 domain-containing protein [Gorillibacterium sp.]|nr:DUF2500 domain-containing protein [Gorillibacterium sp.]
MDFNFGGAPIIFLIVFGVFFTAIVGVILFAIIKGLMTWSKNNTAELRRVTAKVIAKRVSVSGGSGDSSATTHYYMTFELDTRERLEFHVHDQVYGLNVEGDLGTLMFQGSRFKSFDRSN